MAVITPYRRSRRKSRDDEREQREYPRKHHDRPITPVGDAPPVATTPGGPTVLSNAAPVAAPVVATAASAAPQQYYGRLAPQRPVWEMHGGNADTPVAYTPGWTPPVTAPSAPAAPAAPSTPPTATPSAPTGGNRGSGGLITPRSSMSGILFGPPDGNSGSPGVPTVGTWNRALWGKPYTPDADWTKPQGAYNGILMDTGGAVEVHPNSPFGENFTGFFNLGADDPYYAPVDSTAQANEPVDLVGQNTGTTYASTGQDQDETVYFAPSSGGSAEGGETPTVGTNNASLYGKQFDSAAPWQNHQVDPSVQAPVQAMYNPPGVTDSNTTNALMSILKANPQMKAEDAYKLTQTMQAGQAAIQRGETTPEYVQQVLSQLSSGLTPHVPDMTNYRPAPVSVPPGTPMGADGVPQGYVRGSDGSLLRDVGIINAPTVVTTRPDAPIEMAIRQMNGQQAMNITPPKVGSGGLATNAAADPKFDGTGRTLSQIRGTEYWSDEERAWYLMMIGQPVPGGAAPTGPDGRTVAQIRGTDYFSPGERDWYLAQIGKLPTPPQGAAPTSGVTPPVSSDVPTQSAAGWNHWGEGVTYQGGPFGALGNHPYPGDAAAAQQIPAYVEKYRPIVEKYFAPQDVTKALYVITYEGGVDPNTGQPRYQINGPASGLFQIEGGDRHPGRPTREQLLDPETNAAYAAKLAYRR